MNKVNIPPKGTVWGDNCRYNQAHYSAPTLFPIESNYIDKSKFQYDLKQAKARDYLRADWLEEIRQEAREDAYYENCEDEEK